MHWLMCTMRVGLVLSVCVIYDRVICYVMCDVVGLGCMCVWGG